MTERMFAPSGPSGYPPLAPPESISAVRALTLDPARPDTDQGDSATSRQVVRMGRPYRLESDRRRHELLRLLAAGVSFRTACKTSGMSPDALVTLLDEDEFWTVAAALRETRHDLTTAAAA